jgi:hypothetical protein
MNPIVKECACGLEYDRIGWDNLPFAYEQVVSEAGIREIARHCGCGSTLMIVECLVCGALIEGAGPCPRVSAAANDADEYCAPEGGRVDFWWFGGSVETVEGSEMR